MTASLGIACTQDLGGELTTEKLINASDKALYDAKDAGKNCVHLNIRGKVGPCPPVEAPPADSDDRRQRN